MKTIRLIVILGCLLTQHGFAQKLLTDNTSDDYNYITTNALPLITTQLSYTRVFFKYIGAQINWDYYYPKAGNYYNNYGFDNGDGQGMFTDIGNKYYTIGNLNRLDGSLLFVYDGWEANESNNFFEGVFVKVTYSRYYANNLWQIYYNSPANNAKKFNVIDTSVTAYLAENSANQVYYRQENFVATGWGFGVGFLFNVGHLGAGFEFGANNCYIPTSAKENITVNGQTYYYQYTPAWEGRINPSLAYGHIFLFYKF